MWCFGLVAEISAEMVLDWSSDTSVPSSQLGSGQGLGAKAPEVGRVCKSELCSAAGLSAEISAEVGRVDRSCDLLSPEVGRVFKSEWCWAPQSESGKI